MTSVSTFLKAFRQLHQLRNSHGTFCRQLQTITCMRLQTRSCRQQPTCRHIGINAAFITSKLLKSVVTSIQVNSSAFRSTKFFSGTSSAQHDGGPSSGQVPSTPEVEGPPAEERKMGGLEYILSIGIFSAVGFSMYLYVEYLKEEKMRRQNAKDSISTGELDVGGEYELVDHNGRQVNTETFYGKWLLVNFGYCHCPDICPDQLDRMGIVLDELAERTDIDPVQPLFISVDPRDTPEIMKSYINEFHPTFLGLTGSPEQQRRAAKAFRIYFALGPADEDGDYVIDHSIVFYLMDPNGKLSTYFYGKEREGAKEIADTIHDTIKNFEANIGRYIKKEHAAG